MEFITLGIIILVVVGAIAVPVWLVPWLAKKGIGTKEAVMTGNILEMVSILFDNLDLKDEKMKSDVKAVLEVSQKAVEYVEQTMKVAGNEDKKAAAVKAVEDILSQMGIEINDDIKKLIEYGIESAVMNLPKTYN